MFFTKLIGDLRGNGRGRLGRTAHHLLAVGPEVGAGGVVVDCEVGHTADRCCGGDDPGIEVCDRPPRRVSAVGGASNADASRLCHLGSDQCSIPLLMSSCSRPPQPSRFMDSWKGSPNPVLPL